MTRRPRILDVDDAIWLQGDGVFARKLAKISDSVICGNNYLAEYFSEWNRNISVIPTAVNTMMYEGVKARDPVIVWCGSRSNIRFLIEIENILAKVLAIHKDFKLRVIADTPPQFKKIKDVEFIKWSPENEIRYLCNASIGIMPLPDNEWTRGKCAFKMLTYMSAFLPVVVSPVGMNKEVLQLDHVGFGPRNEQEWVEALSCLIKDNVAGRQMGINGRRVVERFFSVKEVGKRIADTIKSTV
jgi:glycosyltransferase involved in cell wall biosynthesis